MSESVGDKFTIGRGSDNKIVLIDQSVSLHHASLSRVDGRFWLRDLGSSNGTYVGDRRITEIEISVGDEVSFGLFKTKFDGMGFLRVNADNAQAGIPIKPKFSLKELASLKRTPILILLLVLMLFMVVRYRSGGLSTTEIARATVLIVVKNSSGEECWSGSGALILDGKYVVTNAHVAALSPEDGSEYSDCEDLSIGFSDNSGLNPSEFVGGAVASIDTSRDLALIELDDPISSNKRTSLSIRESDVGLEMQIRVFGYPGVGGNSLTVSSGVISGLDNSEKFSYFKVSADISSGNSGGPVVDSNGELIGIATAISRQEIDCSSGTTCYSEGNGLGLVRPISLLQPLLKTLK